MGRKKKIKNKVVKSLAVKRPRGRPRKIFTSSAIPVVKRARGRPRNPPGTGVKGYKSKMKEPVDMSNVIIYKALGHCPKCEIVIGTKDFEKGKKNIVVCPCCGERTRIKKLIPKIIREKPATKKEYLEQTIPHSSDFHPFATVPDEIIPTEVLNVKAPDVDKSDESDEDIEADEDNEGDDT